MTRPRSALPAIALLAAVLTGCAATPAEPAAPASGTSAGHGHIEGATEVSEPPLGLMTIDPAGVVEHLDLLDESRAALGEVAPPIAVSGDGRYLFADDRAGVTVIDSGRWTWDHVDHFHYYRAEPRIVGSVTGAGPASVATTNSSTTGSTGVFFAESGEAVLLDTAALSDGEIVERFRTAVAPHDGLLVPIGSFALVTVPDGGEVATLAVLDATGAAVPDAVVECVGAQGTITTRVGAVVGCADAAVLATVRGGGVELERIEYPAGTTAPAATAFANREGRPTVAGLAGDEGIWLLDTRARAWTLLPAPQPLAQVTAVDDDAGHVLALARDGRVLVLDGGSGAVLARTEPLVADPLVAEPEDGGGRPHLIADQQRAYLNAPAEQKLFEIDFADGARIAREFTTTSPPAFLAGTGR